MKTLQQVTLLAFTCAVSLTHAATILDTGSATFRSIRASGEGAGQGVTFAVGTTITGFGLEFFMPEGGSAKFMIWDGSNSHLLYSETREIDPSDTAAFQMTSDLIAFSALANFTYYFGVVGNGELDIQYFFPTISFVQNGMTLVEDGNANYASFESPEAGEAGGATLALRLTGADAEVATPEPATWVTLITGLALAAAARCRR